MSEKEYIRPDESIWSLVEKGILPEWIARDAEPHGMDEAEYILNEYDWEWGWDLGDGYTSEQLRILDEARKRIETGINNYYSNKDLIAKDRAERALWETKRKKREEYIRKFAGQYVDRYGFDWIMDYENEHGELPYLHFVCYKSFLPSRTDIQKAQLLSIGATVDSPLDKDEIQRIFPNLRESQLTGLPYRTWSLTKSYKEFVEEVLAGLPESLPEVDSDYWRNIIESQHLHVFGLTPVRLRRLIHFFRLNQLTPAKRKKLSVGYY